MYAENTNLFNYNNDIETLFSTRNIELVKISEWFKANKYYSTLTNYKTNYTLFRKNSTKDHLPLKLPGLIKNC